MEQQMQPPEKQPIGFWTVRAGEAIRARTRGALAEISVSQPEWWVLHQLSLAPDGADPRRIVATVGPNDTAAAIEAALVTVVDKGWAESDGVALRLSPTGTVVFRRAADLQADLQRERMRGITPDEFVTTITVLQRTITHVGGSAWHW